MSTWWRMYASVQFSTIGSGNDLSPAVPRDYKYDDSNWLPIIPIEKMLASEFKHYFFKEMLFCSRNYAS